MLKHKTPELELARRHRAYIVKAMGETPHEIHDEVSHEGRTIDRVVLTADDVTVYEYKVALTDKLVEQCRLSCGVADFVWAVIDRDPSIYSRADLNMAGLTCHLIGLVGSVRGRFVPDETAVIGRQHFAQPDLLRASIASRHSGEGTAGAKHGYVSKEAKWLTALRVALAGEGKVSPSLAIRMVEREHRIKSPWGSTARTVNAVRRDPPDWLSDFDGQWEVEG